MTTKQVQHQNGTTEYVVQGTGDAIVFLHGAGASAVANWQSSIDLFSKTHKVIAINLPGAGQTTWIKSTLSLTDLIEAIQTVVEAEGESSVSMVGYSTGAVAALVYAAIHSDKTTAVLAMAPWLANPRQKFFFRFWGDLLKTNKELFARYNTLTALSINAHGHMNEEAFEGTAKVFSNTGFNNDLPLLIQLLETMDVEPYLPKINAKTKIIGFMYDMIAPIDQAKKISDIISGSTFAEIEAGHAGPWEATEQMNKEIAEFILKQY